MIFEEQLDPEQEQSGYVPTNENIYMLTQQQKNNIIKRLPRGFCMVRKEQYEMIDPKWKKIAMGPQDIDYDPVKRQREIQLVDPIVKAFDFQNKNQESRRGRLQLISTPDGRSRQSQKIKNIIQRFRKLIKNTQVESFLNKVGYMPGLNYIETQNKKGLLSIDLFRNRYMMILEQAKRKTYQPEVSAQLDDFIQQFTCFVEQARKAQFQNNIQLIQKSIDKVTRYLAETADGKMPGNWYIRKKKRGDRNDNYSDKQILHFGELIKMLPSAYLIGIWEIIYEKPFVEGEDGINTVNLSEVGNKKLRDIQVYVKGKLSQLYRSRERKKQKILAKRGAKALEAKQNNKKVKQQVKEQNQLDMQIRNKLDIDLDDLFIPDYFNSKEQNKRDYDDLQKQKQIAQQEYKQKQQIKNQNEDANQNQNENEKNNQDDSIDINNSSDSSMITDEDDSDY